MDCFPDLVASPCNLKAVSSLNAPQAWTCASTTPSPRASDFERYVVPYAGDLHGLTLACGQAEDSTVFDLKGATVSACVGAPGQVGPAMPFDKTFPAAKVCLDSALIHSVFSNVHVLLLMAHLTVVYLSGDAKI